MIKVGLTGGIGSGKSTVAKVFEILGTPVYYADDAAKKLMNTDEELKEKIQLQFGNDVYKNGKLDRQYLSAIVFNNPQKLQTLNAIVHPATLKDVEKWMQSQATHYALKEAALIFESGAHEHLGYVIGVTAPAPLRMQRTMQRDSLTHEEVLARIDKQMDETIKMKLCHFVINNDEQEMLITQVLAIHEKLLSLSK